MFQESPKKPFTTYVAGQSASIVPPINATEKLAPGGRKKQQKRKAKATQTPKRTQLKLIKGRINLKVPGYKGVQKIFPSHIIRFIPITNVKLAAKRLLQSKPRKKKPKNPTATKESSRKI